MFKALRKHFSEIKAAELDAEAAEWAAQCDQTPDNWRLEQFIRQLIFVPDDMKKGGKNHDLIEEAINGPVHLDVYTADQYTFWLKDLGGHSFPVVLPGSYRPDAYTIVPVEAAPIKGELYFIRPSQFILLDKHKQNGVQFRRERVSIRIPYRTVKYGPHDVLPKISQHMFVTTPAWMYVGVTEYWDPMIGGVFKGQMDLYEHDTKRVWMEKYYKFDV